MSRELGGSVIVYGFDYSDTRKLGVIQSADDRHRVITPLSDAGLTKEEIRQRSRELGLPVVQSDSVKFRRPVYV